MNKLSQERHLLKGRYTRLTMNDECTGQEVQAAVRLSVEVVHSGSYKETPTISTVRTKEN